MKWDKYANRSLWSWSLGNSGVHRRQLLLHIIRHWFGPWYNDPSRRPQTGILIRFLSMFLNCPRFGANFIENTMILDGNRAGMIAEWSRRFLKVILVLETNSKVIFGHRNWFVSLFSVFFYCFPCFSWFCQVPPASHPVGQAVPAARDWGSSGLPGRPAGRPAAPEKTMKNKENK